MEALKASKYWSTEVEPEAVIPGIPTFNPDTVGERPLTKEDLLERMSVRDLMEALGKRLHEVVVLRATDSVETALKVLAHHNILSAPVWSEDPKGYTQVDILDIASSVFLLHGDKYETIVSGFFHRPILEVCNLSQRDPMKVVTLDSKLGELLSAFSTFLHRVIVVDDSQPELHKILAIISQRDVVRFMTEHSAAFAPYTSVQAKDLMQSQPYLVSSEEPTIVVLNKCLKHKYSGAAVIEPATGKLVSNISISDLRNISPATFHTLWLPVPQFLESAHIKRATNVIALESTSMEAILQKMVVEKVHRVWVVNEVNHPIGVISTTDVLRFMLISVSVISD
ncbi:5'-AMP-activated protein kinase subunit gamma-2 [Balamuthia mandrillaris]